MSWHSSNLFPSSSLIWHLLVINPSALLCPGLAGAEPALVREIYPWAWCWKLQRNFTGQREIWNLISQHHIPSACTCTRTHAAVQAECFHSCWMCFCTPLCMWHDLHKPAETDANTNINCIVTGTEQFFLLMKGIIENLQHSFREE